MPKIIQCEAIVSDLSELVQQNSRARQILRASIARPSATWEYLARYSTGIPLRIVAQAIANKPGNDIADHFSLGVSLRKLRALETVSENGVDARLRMILESDIELLGEILGNIIRYAQNNEIIVDFTQLLYDIEYWSHPDQFVQRRWAIDYWG